MDKVRLGRALGYGTRHAARTLAAVAEAATAPDPRAAGPATPVGATQQQQAPRTTAKGVPVRATVRGAARGAKASFWGPLATYSGALWLRVTGTFFALVTAAMGSGAWRLRAAPRAGTVRSAEAGHFWIFAGVAVLFGYFAVSSFLRANARERQGS